MAGDVDLAPLIAIVGCDGAGKSQLSSDLIAHIGRSRPAEAGYLGEGSSVQGKKIGQWPFVGPWLKSRLEKIADRLRDSESTIPSGLVARYALYRSKKRFRRFEALQQKRRDGVVIVTDRYPQAEIAGYHDGPILAGVAKSPDVARIKAEERALYQRMAAYVPTLVIRLHVDIDTAMARKPDHNRTLVSQKIAALPKTSFNGAPIFDLDTTAKYEDELSLAKAAVDRALAA